MSKPTIDASVVIINKNDRGISGTLEALASHTTKYSFEVIVVDASGGALDDIAARFPATRWVPFTAKPAKTISIPEQRNVGVRYAQSDIIVFTDANCIPMDGWLDLLLEPLFEGDECIVAGSTIASGTSGSLHDHNYERVADREYLHECPTINLAFKREVFTKLGGFDERFDYGSDVDFSWRAIKQGYAVRYVSAAQVVHEWGGTRENAKRAYRYGVARARLYKKHPGQYRQLLHADIAMVVYTVYLIGLPLTVWLWWYPLLIGLLLIKNIRNHPVQVVRYHLIYAVGALRELARV